MRYCEGFFLVMITIVLFHSCKQSSLEDLSFLEGTWKAEEKNLYEEWKFDDGGLLGKSFMINNGVEEVSEILKIRIEGNEIIYTAQVFDQNNGKSIPFKLLQASEFIFSFENPDHDFPQKIIYEKKNDSLIYVNVLGSDEQGFSYFMKKI